ncbi:MAG: hypothetical protein ACJ8AW_12490 [Rhodopila sp.]
MSPQPKKRGRPRQACQQPDCPQKQRYRVPAGSRRKDEAPAPRLNTANTMADAEVNAKLATLADNGPVDVPFAERDPAGAAAMKAALDSPKAEPAMEAAIERLQTKVLPEAPKRVVDSKPDPCPAPARRLTPAELAAAVAPQDSNLKLLAFYTCAIAIGLVALFLIPTVFGTGMQIYVTKTMPWVTERLR